MVCFRNSVSLLALAAVAWSSSAPILAAAELPNVVVILADDVGYGDLSCYGATKVATPNLDRMAASGMRFVDCHSAAAVCTPSRYALLTGQYAWRHRPASGILNGVAPLCIPSNRMTVAQLLQRAGYDTAAVGKWHLGFGAERPDFNGVLEPGARAVGFDYSFLIPATGDRTPCVFVENGLVVGADPNDPIRVSYGAKIGTEPTGKENPDRLTVQRPSHGHDATIVNGISRIGFMAGGKHARWKDENIADDLTSRAVAFIERKRSKPFFLYFAPHDIHVPRVPHPRFRGSSGHGLRGDAIVELDWSVGRILQALDDSGFAQNTLVIFSSDNGGVMDDGYIDGSGDDRSGHRCNGPLRGFKGGLYEGGHRVPFIVRWPGKTPAGTISRELICHVDLLATMAELTGKALDDSAGPDSVSILPALLSEKPVSPARVDLVLQGGNPNALAFRHGPWKLIPAVERPGDARRGANAKPQLFNLDDDLAETRDLAAVQPRRVAELTELLHKWRTDQRTR